MKLIFPKKRKKCKNKFDYNDLFWCHGTSCDCNRNVVCRLANPSCSCRDYCWEVVYDNESTLNIPDTFDTAIEAIQYLVENYMFVRKIKANLKIKKIGQPMKYNWE